MRFAVVLPWWGYALAFGAAVILGWLAYARVPVKLTLGKRLGLSALRAFTLLLLIAIAAARHHVPPTAAQQLVADPRRRVAQHAAARPFDSDASARGGVVAQGR